MKWGSLTLTAMLAFFLVREYVARQRRARTMQFLKHSATSMIEGRAQMSSPVLVPISSCL